MFSSSAALLYRVHVIELYQTTVAGLTFSYHQHVHRLQPVWRSRLPQRGETLPPSYLRPGDRERPCCETRLCWASSGPSRFPLVNDRRTSPHPPYGNHARTPRSHQAYGSRTPYQVHCPCRRVFSDCGSCLFQTCASTLARFRSVRVCPWGNCKP